MLHALLLTMFALTTQSKAPAPNAAPNLVRVYVCTDDTGETGDREGRDESVKDLRAALADKKKDLVLVRIEDDADIVVTVVERTTTIPRVVFAPPITSSQPPTGMGIERPAPVKAVHLHVTLTYREEPLVFTNKTTPFESNGGWRTAADDIAKQLDKWIVDHRGEILATRIP